MAGLLQRFSNTLDRLARWILDLTAVLLLAMLVLITVEVAGRYGFNYSTLIADEYGGYLFVWITFLGFCYALRSGQFLRVEVVVRHMPARLQGAAELFAAVVGFAVSAIVAYASLETTLTSYRFGSVSIQPSVTHLFLPQLVMPVGMGLLCLAYLDEVLRRLVRLRGGGTTPTVEPSP